MSFRFSGGIEQPKVQSVIGLFRRESVCTPDSIDCQETVDEADETDEYTPAKMDSPAKTKGTWRKAEGGYVLVIFIFFPFLSPSFLTRQMYSVSILHSPSNTQSKYSQIFNKIYIAIV